MYYNLDNRKRDKPSHTLGNKLAIPQKRSPRSGGSSGHVTVIKVNYVPIDLEELFKRTVYPINVIFNPSDPKRLQR